MRFFHLTDVRCDACSNDETVVSDWEHEANQKLEIEGWTRVAGQNGYEDFCPECSANKEDK